MNRAQILRGLNEVEQGLDMPHQMLACPYIVSGGTCVTGCWSEPRCVTEEPIGGWESGARESAASFAGWARELAWEARGCHGLVKRARDVMRRAEKLARP